MNASTKIALLFLFGLAVELVASALIDYPRCLATYPSCMDMIPRDALIVYSLAGGTVLFALLLAPAPKMVIFHRFVVRELERTIVKRDDMIRLFIVIFGFDFVVVTLLCSLPLGTLLVNFLPGLNGAQGLLSRSIFDLQLLDQPAPVAVLLIFMWYCLPAFPGPAVVSLGSLLRSKDQRLNSTVRSLLKSIVVLSYVALFFAVFYWLVGSISITSGVSLSTYLTLIFGISLPGSILATAIAYGSEINLASPSKQTPKRLPNHNDDILSAIPVISEFTQEINEKGGKR